MLGKLPPIIGLAGWSGSGKTTLCAKIIENFTKIGISVGTLKHAHQKFDIDKPGKDSYKLRKAGAQPMVISSKERFALIQENGNEEKNLFEILDIFSKNPVNECELILIEGYKNEFIKKLEVFRSEIDKPFLYPNDRNIFAIVSEKKIQAPIPYYNINNIRGICELLIKTSETQLYR